MALPADRPGLIDVRFICDGKARFIFEVLSESFRVFSQVPSSTSETWASTWCFTEKPQVNKYIWIFSLVYDTVTGILRGLDVISAESGLVRF